MQGISIKEKLFIGSDLNGHVGIVVMRLIVYMEDLIFGERNEPGNSILDFSPTHLVFCTHKILTFYLTIACTHKILTFRLTIASTNSVNLPVREPIFHDANLMLYS